jgi:hypothetical protein
LPELPFTPDEEFVLFVLLALLQPYAVVVLNVFMSRNAVVTKRTAPPMQINLFISFVTMLLIINVVWYAIPEN